MHLLSAALLALAPSTALAGTFVVAPTPGPGVDFTSIQAAIDAAVDGDELVLRAGSYQEQVVVDGKSLVVHGEPGAAVFMVQNAPLHQPLMSIVNLAADQVVELRDVDLVRVSTEPGLGLLLADNAGQVRVQNVFIDTYSGHGLVARASDEVLLVDTFLQCNAPHLDPSGSVQPSHGLVVEQGSAVFAYDVMARGSHGFLLGQPGVHSVAGGDGAQVLDASLYAVQPVFDGGAGNAVSAGGCDTVAPGGAGLRVVQTGSEVPVVELRAPEISGGPMGFSSNPCLPLPPAAPPLAGVTSAVQLVPGAPRLLLGSGNPSFGGFVEVELHGAPGDVYLLFAAGAPTPVLPLPGIDGFVAIEPAGAKVVRTGTLGPNGAGEVLADAALLPSNTFHLQALMVDPAGAAFLSNPLGLRIP